MFAPTVVALVADIREEAENARSLAALFHNNEDALRDLLAYAAVLESDLSTTHH